MTIDLDNSTSAGRLARWRPDPLTAVTAGLIAGVLLGLIAASAVSKRPPAAVSVTVTASPTREAAAAIWQPDGQQVTPPWNQPTTVDPAARAAVFVRAGDGDPGASCTISVDGRPVSSHTATGPGTVAVCGWPD